MEAFRLSISWEPMAGWGQDQLNGDKRVARVAIEHRKKRYVFVGWLKTFLSDCHRTSFQRSNFGEIRLSAISRYTSNRISTNTFRAWRIPCSASIHSDKAFR